MQKNGLPSVNQQSSFENMNNSSNTDGIVDGFSNPLGEVKNKNPPPEIENQNDAATTLDIPVEDVPVGPVEQVENQISADDFASLI